MRALAAALFFSAVTLAFGQSQSSDATSLAQQKQALTAQATREIGLGHLDRGAMLTCQAAQLDPGDKDLAAECMSMTRAVQKQLDKFDGYFMDAVQLASSRHWDNADKMFRRITFGPHKSDADEWLQTKLPAVRKAAEAKTPCQCQRVEATTWRFPE